MKTNTPTAWAYALPATNDPDGDSVSISVTIPSSASFLVFSDNELKISNLQDESNTAIPVGQYIVDVALDDGNEGSAAY